MTLNPTPLFPAAGCYVLKLHRDAAPAQGRWLGRLEHIASGEQADFASREALLDWLQQHATALGRSPQHSGCQA